MDPLATTYNFSCTLPFQPGMRASDQHDALDGVDCIVHAEYPVDCSTSVCYETALHALLYIDFVPSVRMHGSPLIPTHHI